MLGTRAKILRRVGLLGAAWAGFCAAAPGPTTQESHGEGLPSQGASEERTLDPLERELRLRRWAYAPEAIPWDRRTTLAQVQQGEHHWTWLYDRADALGRTPEGAQVPHIEHVFSWGRDSAYPSLQRAVDQVRHWSDRLGQGRAEWDHVSDFLVDSDLGSEWGVVRWRGRIENTVLYSRSPWTWSSLVQTLMGPRRAASDDRWHAIASAYALQAPDWGPEDRVWFQDGEGALHLPRLQGENPSLLHLPLSAAFLESLRGQARTPEESFTVEALVLAGALRGSHGLAVQREALHLGWVHWRDEHGAVWPWQEVDRRKAFLARVARLGDRDLGEFLWRTARDLEATLTQPEWEALGGLRNARQDFFAWACDSLEIDDILRRAHDLDHDDAGWVFDTCLNRLGDASLPMLRSWAQPGRPTRIREQALAGALRHGESPSLRAFVTSLWADEDFALVRASMRASREWTLNETEATQLAQAWSVWGPERRLSLLRWMRPDALPTPILAECMAWLERDPHADPYLIDVLAHSAPPEQALPLLMEGWQRDFAVAQARWTADEGRDVNAGVVRLTAWVKALTHMDRSLVRNGWAQDWLQRVWMLSDQKPERASYVLGKAVLASLVRHAEGRAWLRERCESTWGWPRRLRIEVALQLAPFGSEEGDSSLQPWLREVHRQDERGLGVVLRERWWKAMAQRPESWDAELSQVAAHGREAGTVREAAMRALAARGRWQPLFAVLASERPEEGVWLAAEVLAERGDAEVAAALRERLAAAVARVRAGGRESELAEETLVALQIALVQAGQWQPADAQHILLAPNLRYRPALQQRLRGATKPEHWPREMRLCAHLAAQGQLAATIDADPERWLRLPGPYLARLAETAWIGRDEAATRRLVRMAEIAVAGEAADMAGRDAHITVQKVRFLLAWQTEEWPLARAYGLRLWHLVQQGGQGARRLESTLGVLDWRRGIDPGAALAAGSWQAAAFAALEGGELEEARWARDQAERWVGRSAVARETQVRLEAALQESR